MSRSILILLLCASSLGGPSRISGARSVRCPEPASNTTSKADASLGMWTKGVPLPTARSEASSAVLDGLTYGGGGIDATHQPSTAFEVYDPAGNSWRKAAPSPAALHRPAAAGGDAPHSS